MSGDPSSSDDEYELDLVGGAMSRNRDLLRSAASPGSLSFGAAMGSPRPGAASSCPGRGRKECIDVTPQKRRGREGGSGRASKSPKGANDSLKVTPPPSPSGGEPADDTDEEEAEQPAAPVRVLRNGRCGRRSAKPVTKEQRAVKKKTELALKKLERLGKKRQGAEEVARRAAQEDGEVIELDAQEEQFDLKFLWKGEVVRETVTENEFLGSVFGRIARKVGVDFERLDFSLDSALSGDADDGSAKLEPTKTVAEKCLSIVSLVNVRQKLSSRNSAESYISIRFRTADKKTTTEVRIRTFEKLQAAMSTFSEKQRAGGRLRFVFDGDELDGTETPVQLDMEDGDCVDVF